MTYKTLLQEVKKELNKLRYIPCSWIRILTFVKMSILPKLSIELMQIQPNCFYKINKLILKSI